MDIVLSLMFANVLKAGLEQTVMNVFLRLDVFMGHVMGSQIHANVKMGGRVLFAMYPFVPRDVFSPMENVKKYSF